MWESILHTSRGGNSARRIFTYATSAFIAAFLWILIASPAHAANAADATWKNDAITYQKNTYKATKATNNSKPVLKAGTVFYEYVEFTMTGELAHEIYFPNNDSKTATTAKYVVYKVDNAKYGSLVTSANITITPQAKAATTSYVWSNGNITDGTNTYKGTGGTYSVADGSNPPLPKGTKYYAYIDTGAKKAYLIYFSASSDPPTEKTATYQSFDISVSGDTTTWSNASAKKTISITPVNGTTSTAAGTDDSSDATSCSVDGIGWIVCPISNFLASGMDTIYNLLKGYLQVKPISTATDQPLYKAWNYVRSIADVAFVIAFLIIIYSQITNIGITNYSIKKLLPRLIVSAILVNISYYLCAIAVDISNILGGSLYQFFINMKTDLSAANTNNVANWESVTGFVLAGGTAAAAAGIGIASTIAVTGASAGAAIILLLPMLVALILAVIVALVVLAARQALIIILIIAAPLAFVAYLLPNTEKWFAKWRKFFMDMLVFFPIFSVIFGGSQLAGTLIMTNTDQIDVILLGMFVQVAPIIITPLLVRFSGDIVGKVAGIVNNPKKGLLDRTRNWSKDRSELMAARKLSSTQPLRPTQVFSRYARGSDLRRRIRGEQKSAYESLADGQFRNTQEYSNINQISREGAERKALGESLSEERYNKSRVSNVTIRNLDIDVRNAHEEAANAKLASDVQYENLKAPASALNIIPADLATRAILAHNGHEQSTLLERQLFAAKNMQTQNYAQELIKSDRLQRIAGGIDPNGAASALAAAVTAVRTDYGKSIEEARSIVKHFNLSAQQRQAHALGEEIVIRDEKDPSIIKYTFKKDSVFTREAVIEDQITLGTAEEATEIIKRSGKGQELYSFRTSIAAAMPKSALGAKTLFNGGQTINDVAQGNIVGDAGIDMAVQRTLEKGKMSEKIIAGLDPYAIDRYFKVVQSPDYAGKTADQRKALDDKITNFVQIAKDTLGGDEVVNVTDEARNSILKIIRLTDPNFVPRPLVKRDNQPENNGARDPSQDPYRGSDS